MLITVEKIPLIFAARDWIGRVEVDFDPGEHGCRSGHPDRWTPDYPAGWDATRAWLDWHEEDDADLPPLGLVVDVDACEIDDDAVWEALAQKRREAQEAAAADVYDHWKERRMGL